VHLHRIDVGAIQQRLVGGRVIGPDRLDQLELAQDARAWMLVLIRRRTLAVGGIVEIGSFGGRRGLPRRQDGDTVGGFRRQ